MAQRLSNGAVAAHELEANEIDRVVSIRIDQVRLGERLRPVDMVWAAALAQVIARDGQQTPIEVCREPEADHWTLVSGGHRLEGMRAAGIEWISAIEVSANDRERRRREISENLNHVRIAHGDRGGERARGQRAVRPRDFRHIPRIVREGSPRLIGEPGRRKQQRIEWELEIGRERYVMRETIGPQKLLLQSLRIVKLQ